MSWIFPRDSVQVPSGLTGTKFHPAKWTEERETLAVCPLHPHLCSEQVMPSPERVQKTRVDNQGTEQGRQKESSNHHAHNQDLPDSSETQLPRDAQHVMAPGPQPELSLEAVGENPTWIAVEDHKALGRRNNPRVNWNPDHWLRRYNYMDIYICIYIYICYVQETELSGTTEPTVQVHWEQFSGHLQTSGKRQWSLNTGAEGRNAATPPWRPFAKWCHENRKLLFLEIKVVGGMKSLSSELFSKRSS